MRRVVGVDVSKTKLNYYVINEDWEKELEGVVKNNLEGFENLIEIMSKSSSEIIFEPTGVYSQKLQLFLEMNKQNYVLVNPLLAKKEMDTLRSNKNDELDAKNLAILQMTKEYKFTKRDTEIYQDLRWGHHFYQELTQDLAKLKNRLHRSVQLTFSEIENLYVGENDMYYKILTLIPHSHIVSGLEWEDVAKIIEPVFSRKGRIVENRAKKIVMLANKNASAVYENSPITDEVVYWAEKALELMAKKEELMDKLIEKASKLDEFEIIKSIPGFGDKRVVGFISELGNIRKFKTPQKMNTFVGLDLKFSDSGQFKSKGHISKKGNSIARMLLYKTTLSVISTAALQKKENPVSNWYNHRSKFELNGKKKILVGAMDRTLRLVHKLVISGELYNS